jgi:pimeloyl-ACP methyl ester carboxylesterase
MDEPLAVVSASLNGVVKSGVRLLPARLHQPAFLDARICDSGAAKGRAMPDTAFHEMPDGRRIAFRFTPGTGPALVFLPGYMSDMAGGKACAVFDRAADDGRACLLLDYSGCGESGGHFAEGTLSRWRDEVLALIGELCPGPVVLIGSSMGGWLMLLVALALPPQWRAGLVGIAAAPDFTDWGRSDEDKAKLAAGDVIYEPNQYGPEPTPTHPGFWADGEANRLLEHVIPIDCPVRLLHGQADPDVPWGVSLRLAEALRSADVQVTLIKDGDHRLSRDDDIALLLRTVADAAGAPG